MTDGREVAAHVALALSRYVPKSTHEGRRVPAELLGLLDVLADLVKARQDPIGRRTGDQTITITRPTPGGKPLAVGRDTPGTGPI